MIEEITIMGVKQAPGGINVDGMELMEAIGWEEATGTLLVAGLSMNLGGERVVTW